MILKENIYCNSLVSYSRWKTREVKIGDVALGANNPIRVQSMTTTDSMDTQSTVEQSIRMIDAGCEYVRITAPSINEAENLLNIKNELKNDVYRNKLAEIVFDLEKFTPTILSAQDCVIRLEKNWVNLHIQSLMDELKNAESRGKMMLRNNIDDLISS